MIKAKISAENPHANLGSYAKTYGEFSWAEAERQFTWHETGRMNIAFEAIDRWARNPQTRDQKALVIEDGNAVRCLPMEN